jgi:nitrogen fixation NifU-like protein
MVAPQLRALANAAAGQGALSGDAVGHGRAEHPVCGDEVEVDVRVQRGRIAELRWRARGCPATYAVAAVGALELDGAAVDGAAAALRRGLAARGDLAAAERHAEAMFVRALQAAIAQAPGSC